MATRVWPSPVFISAVVPRWEHHAADELRSSALPKTRVSRLGIGEARLSAGVPRSSRSVPTRIAHQSRRRQQDVALAFHWQLERLTLQPDGRVLVALKAEWHDGTTHLCFEPVALLERLAALTPRPRVNLVVYHGLCRAQHKPCYAERPLMRSPPSPKPSSLGWLWR